MRDVIYIVILIMLIGYFVFQEIRMRNIKKKADEQLLDEKAKHSQEILDVKIQAEKKMENILKKTQATIEKIKEDAEVEIKLVKEESASQIQNEKKEAEEKVRNVLERHKCNMEELAGKSEKDILLDIAMVLQGYGSRLDRFEEKFLADGIDEKIEELRVSVVQKVDSTGQEFEGKLYGIAASLDERTQKLFLGMSQQIDRTERSVKDSVVNIGRTMNSLSEHMSDNTLKLQDRFANETTKSISEFKKKIENAEKGLREIYEESDISEINASLEEMKSGLSSIQSSIDDSEYEVDAIKTAINELKEYLGYEGYSYSDKLEDKLESIVSNLPSSSDISELKTTISEIKVCIGDDSYDSVEEKLDRIISDISDLK